MKNIKKRNQKKLNITATLIPNKTKNKQERKHTDKKKTLLHNCTPPPRNPYFLVCILLLS